MSIISCALLSVSDKTGIVDFAKVLADNGVRIISTGGTAKLLIKAKIPVLEVSEYTNFPEMLNGRLKTLHPKIHGGILAIRDNLEHSTAMIQHEIEAIDLVCVNLYPFEATVASKECTIDDAVEDIDIGGPTMIRAAAKNWQYVSVVTDIEDYAAICAEFSSSNGALSSRTRFALAQKAFTYTSIYDKAISAYFASQLSGKPEVEIKTLPDKLNFEFVKLQNLRYGENPHQAAAFYLDTSQQFSSVAKIKYHQLHGKEMSYNNIVDADAAFETVKEFSAPACVIVKHANPCGVAQSDSLLNAYKFALATDMASAFGGIVALNKKIDIQTAIELSEQFIEVLIAPGFEPEALSIISSKKNIRILEADFSETNCGLNIKPTLGGYLVQEANQHILSLDETTCPTKRIPTKVELEDLLFAWKVVKHVKSNAVVFCRGGRTLGIGAGQMSRVDSTRLAVQKSKDAGFSLLGSVAASDAFFPFRDGIDVIAEQGILAIMQPGGSVRDSEVIYAADEHSIAMLLTGIRCFYH